MKWTPHDIFVNAVLSIAGTATLFLGVYLSEVMDTALSIWITLVSCSIFSLYTSIVLLFVRKMKGHRTELGKEIDALRERVDAIERGIEE